MRKDLWPRRLLDLPATLFMPLFFLVSNGFSGPKVGRIMSSYEMLTFITLSVGRVISAVGALGS